MLFCCFQEAAVCPPSGQAGTRWTATELDGEGVILALGCNVFPTIAAYNQLLLALAALQDGTHL